jgi:hypothetical protein
VPDVKRLVVGTCPNCGIRVVGHVVQPTEVAIDLLVNSHPMVAAKPDFRERLSLAFAEVELPDGTEETLDWGILADEPLEVVKQKHASLFVALMNEVTYPVKDEEDGDVVKQGLRTWQALKVTQILGVTMGWGDW